jgi:hypothetical protein
MLIAKTQLLWVRFAMHFAFEPLSYRLAYEILLNSPHSALPLARSRQNGRQIFSDAPYMLQINS